MGMTRKEIVAADWKDNREILYTIAGATMLTMLGVTWFKPDGIDAKTVLIISSIFSAMLICHLCSLFTHETAGVKPFDLDAGERFVAAKFVAALSMAAFAINIPGLMLLDFRLLLNLNAGVLLLEAVCTSLTVTESCASGGVEVFEIFVVAMGFMASAIYWWGPPLYDYGQKCVDWLIAHSTLTSIAALCAIPVVVLWSMLFRIPIDGDFE